MRLVGGRTSAETKAAESALVELQLSRPKAPKSLTADQARLWARVVRAMPANWFREEMLEGLEAYCVAVTRWRAITADINRLQALGVIDEAFYRAVSREALAMRAMMALATKLRLTPRSLYDKTKKRPVALRKPWEERE
jgi:phage terminase small subunit